MEKILAATGSTLDVLTYDASGALADAGSGNGSAVVVDSAGAAIAGSPLSAVRVAVGTYRITLPEALDALDVYDVTTTMPDTTTRFSQFEMVGSFLFTIASLRAFDTELAVESRYSAARIRDVREIVDERFAEAANLSFTRRGRREVLDGDGSNTLYVGERSLLSVTSGAISDVALTTEELDDLAVYRFGKVVRRSASWTAGYRNVELLYEYGSKITPAPVAEAARKYARFLLVKGVFDDAERATGIQTELGFQRMTLAGRDGPTGLPDVDAVLAQFGRARIPAIA